MAIAKAKLVLITQLAFSRSLEDLKAYLGLTGHIRQYIPYYAQVARPFQERKTLLNCSVNIAGNARKKEVARTYIFMPTNQELNAFHHLQQLFLQPSILLHYDPSRQLYIYLNVLKAFGFRAMVYHSKNTITEDNETPSKKTSIELILFLSQLLMDAETQYWSTELETAGLVWTIRKFRHMVELAKMPTIVYKNHIAIVLIAQQTNLTTTTATN